MCSTLLQIYARHLDKNGQPLVALHWQHCFKRIYEKYEASGRPSMPVVTPHVCRHTYCSNMAKSGINPKVLQYLMGNGTADFIKAAVQKIVPYNLL